MRSHALLQRCDIGGGVIRLERAVAGREGRRGRCRTARTRPEREAGRTRIVSKSLSRRSWATGPAHAHSARVRRDVDKIPTDWAGARGHSRDVADVDREQVEHCAASLSGPCGRRNPAPHIFPPVLPLPRLAPHPRSPHPPSTASCAPWPTRPPASARMRACECRARGAFSTIVRPPDLTLPSPFLLRARAAP